MTRIPIDQQLVDAISYVDSDLQAYLKPPVLACLLRKLPAGIEYNRMRSDGYVFYFPGEGLNRVYIFLYHPQVVAQTTKFNHVAGTYREIAELVHGVLEECALEKVDHLEGIQSKVQEREYKKATRMAEEMQTPSGKQLPTDVARKIAEFAAPKKIDGGRKRKSRKVVKKTRKQTKRRRV